MLEAHQDEYHLSSGEVPSRAAAWASTKGDVTTLDVELDL